MRQCMDAENLHRRLNKIIGQVRAIDRMVSVSVLATFLRDFPLTYLTKDERRVFMGFQKYIIHLEGQLFEKAGVSR